MAINISATALVQRIWGVFSGTTGALQGVTVSGEQPYTPMPVSLFSVGVPMIMPSSGNIGTNGALTGITALLQTYSTGCYMYFPVGAVFSGSVNGFYFVQMSSTTAGTIFGNTYVTPGGGIPQIPSAAQLLPLTTTGPGAYTQETSATKQFINIPLAGGQMGVNGCLRMYAIFANNNSGNTKNMAVAYGGQNLASVATTTQISTRFLNVVFNRGVQNNQVQSAPGQTGFGALTVANAVNTVDFSSNQNIVTTGQLTNATDWCMMDGCLFEVIPG